MQNFSLPAAELVRDGSAAVADHDTQFGEVAERRTAQHRQDGNGLLGHEVLAVGLAFGETASRVDVDRQVQLAQLFPQWVPVAASEVRGCPATLVEVGVEQQPDEAELGGAVELVEADVDRLIGHERQRRHSGESAGVALHRGGDDVVVGPDPRLDQAGGCMELPRWNGRGQQLDVGPHGVHDRDVAAAAAASAVSSILSLTAW